MGQVPTGDSAPRLRLLRPTMKDVAAHSGVALKTVSRVVNDEAGVSSSTRATVKASIEALGFRRNANAAGLRHKQTASIGLVLEDISEPFQSTIARVVEKVAIERKSLLFTGSSSDDDKRERNLVLSLCARPVDGLIIIPSADDHSYLQTELDMGIAAVFIDRPAIGVEADTVLSDNRAGAREGVTHLIRHGHRRIAFIGDTIDFYTGAERYAGYCDALANAGIAHDSQLVSLGHPDRDRIARHVETIARLPEPATALFTGNSLNTLATLRALTGHRRDFAHVAFDDFELFDLLDPGVTVVAQDPAGMGTVAAELLFRRLQGESTGKQTVLLKTSLIERGSGELRP